MWRQTKSPLVRCPNGMVMEPFCNQSSLTIETFRVNIFSPILHLRIVYLNHLNGSKHLSGKGLTGVKALHGIPATLLHPCSSTLSVTKENFLTWNPGNIRTILLCKHLSTVFLLTQGLWDWVTDAVSGEATSAHPPGASKARLCSYNFSPLW